MTSLRRIQANQLNAQRSTGPKTEQGKERSKTNAVRHGLSGVAGVMPEAEAHAVQERLDAWRGSFQLVTPEDEWLFQQMVVSTIRIDRCQQEERAARIDEAKRAALSWEEDRAREAEALGAKLSRQPSVISRALLATTQGCNWLLTRWRGLWTLLQEAETSPENWTDSHQALLFDLLGYPVELRPASLPDDPRTLVEREIARLEQYQNESLNPLDDFDRGLAETGLSTRLSRREALIRRYEAASFRIFERGQSRLKRRQVDHAEVPPPSPPPPPFVPEPDPETEPEPDPEPEPATIVETSPQNSEPAGSVETRSSDENTEQEVDSEPANSEHEAAPARRWGNRAARKAAMRRQAS